MSAGKQLIKGFYEAFSRKDFESMAKLYHPDGRFSDPVFGELSGKEIASMWKMLCLRGKDLQITFEISGEQNELVFAKWKADYTFGKSGRKVHNEINSEFLIRNGKIAVHSDDFNLWKWSAQALGITGYLLGWTAYFRKSLRQKTKDSLKKFMESSG